MSAHTPGPWVWTNGDSPINIATYKSPGYHANAELHAGDKMIVGCDEYWVLGPTSDRDQMVANARLIAAAPEMLDALKAAIAPLNAYRGYGWGDRGGVIEALQAAIAKAEGRT